MNVVHVNAKRQSIYKGEIEVYFQSERRLGLWILIRMPYWKRKCSLENTLVMYLVD